MLITMDYSKIKGANYTPSYACNPISFWRDYDPQIVSRELGYAKNLGLNCVRVFLSYVVFEYDPEGFFKHVDHLVQTAKANDLGVMLVLFDGCFNRNEPTIEWNKNEWIPNPGCMNLEEHFWEKGNQYCQRLIERFGKEPSVLFWDVMNEPECTSFLSEETGDSYEKNLTITYRFVRHYAELLSNANLFGAITVGSDCTRSNENLVKFDVLKYLDVISFHDYSHNTATIQKNYNITLELGKKHGKPVIISETGCPPRGNPYDLAIEIANKNNMGYFLWELMIGKSFWNDRHGIVYPDGTIRDTALVAALFGYFRNRTPDAICYDGNAEGRASSFVKLAQELLDKKDANFEEYMDVLESFTNLTESCQIVPLKQLPSSRLSELRKTGDLQAVKEELKKQIALLKDVYHLE
ncbi:MAG: hypothetical protein E7414_01880 [Ruminococcaceae bacterium]|nr:hypothetical protein [Oscillospiraceae bacterium]